RRANPGAAGDVKKGGLWNLVTSQSRSRSLASRVRFSKTDDLRRCLSRAQAAARAQAGERYDAFVAALGRRLAKSRGRRFPKISRATLSSD
ncbi:hypothetical protein NKI59_34685, partial [Mesorhizobium sp. M0598]